MEITYVSSCNAKSIKSYSGTGYYIPTKLKQAGDQIEYIGELRRMNPISQKIKCKLYKTIGKNYLIERNPDVLQLWARKIEKKLNPSSNLVMSYSSQPFSQLQVKTPKVFWSDAVFASMIDYYPIYSNLCSESIKDGNKMEKQALINSDIAVFSSHWAAKAAIQHYDVPQEKVKVVNYGANIEVDFTYNQISYMTKQKPLHECNLLFMGVAWYRKGGDIAVEITRMLREKGINANLTIVGLTPKKEVDSLNYVKSYGFISKSDPTGQKLFSQIVARSHFLVLPTRADCTPIVYSEFNAYGIPAITTNEGGIPSLITNGVNGYMFNKDDSPDLFAEKIAQIFSDKKRYTELCISSFNEFKTRLNWEYSIHQLRNILQEIISIP